MTSEVDDLKTNEILRRRKLRLQQVREQSKDIARKIRQRAKVENLRQVIELDSKKKKQYLQRQEQLVKKLEEYYAAGLENVGSSHKNASEVRLQGADGDKIDLSKQRGREAAAELRKKRQQILDKQKELLDRKLQAREVANEISRDKSGAAANRLQAIPASTDIVELQSKSSAANFDAAGNIKNSDVARSDMATQWDLDEMANEWEPNIPTLLLPKDDDAKESNNNNVDSKSDKSKRIDLFAVSEEMPSSLRGGLTNPEERVPVKSSLTLVSEYLQNRDLRLRETDTSRTNKNTEDIQSLKQTILRTRTSKEVPGKEDRTDKQFKSTKCTEDSSNPRKSVVTMYNHTTRDIRDIPFCDERLVIRNSQDTDDAYSQAMKESSSSQNKDKDHLKKVQEVRSKVAVTKQNVEKEYRDTISFLNALPKDKGERPIKTAYMDEQRQQMKNDMRQQKLQQEYRKIVKECSKQNCKNKPRSKSKSPVKGNSDVFESTDMQYSWMPIPENDDLAVHTIPTTVREGKSNSVKFSKVDSYHEYRSRHKHTPPTKETADKPRYEDNSESFERQDSSDSESISSGSSVKSVRLVKQDKPKTNNKELSDAERIIIYKILDTKVDEQKKTSKLMKNIAKSLTRIEQKTKIDEQKSSSGKKSSGDDNIESLVSVEQLAEGVYKTVNENGDNIASMYFHKEAQATGDNNVPQCCAAGRKHSKQVSHKAAPQQWNDNDEVKTRCSPPVVEHNNNCSCKTVRSKDKDKSLPVGQPSITTSTASFLTAVNDKASSATSEGGFIKLVDDGGREAGKFYIGASGLLNNDAYEVVIQLRKKGDENELPNTKSEHKKNEAPAADVVTVVSATQTSMRDICDDYGNKGEAVVAASDTTEPQESKIQETGRDSYRSEDFTDRGSRQPMYSVQRNEPKVSVKGVSAAVEDTNAQNVPDLQPAPAPRPATTACTQTTLNSPTHHPVLMHMSSSTSTAYMSPPEMIVPNFMKPGYKITHADVYDPRNYAVDEINSAQHEYTEGLDCDCRKCMHARRLMLNSHVRARRHRCRSARKPSTPPNTDRIARSEVLDHSDFDEDCETVPALVIENSDKQSKYTYRKFTGRKHNHDVNDSLSHKKSRHTMHSKPSSQNLGNRVHSSTSTNKVQMSSKRSKTGLNPAIKNYVDKLLKLNKESLKAVQIVDQECSYVTTPASSVVNVPNNIDKRKSKVENKLSLEKIRDILKQKIIDESGKNSDKTDPIKGKNTQMCYRAHSIKNIKTSKLPRKKTAHKVKSLNISKKMSRNLACDSQTIRQQPVTSSSSIKGGCIKKQLSSSPSRCKMRSKSSPTPRLPPNSDTTDRSGNSDLPHTKFIIPKLPKDKSKATNVKQARPAFHISGSSNHAMTTTSNDSDRNPRSLNENNSEVPLSISTQTSINADTEMNYMKLAEDKLQNMEKIADLTEKCTKRLSSLAKVLEEVRKNKTLVYSHISSSDVTSDSDNKSDKNGNNVPLPQEPSNDISKESEPVPDLTKSDSLKENNLTDYVPFLSNIPKPAFKSLNSDASINSSSSKKSNSASPVPENVDQSNKPRGKPPPALSRMHLKHGQDFVVPHELSTVVEVDSPMSIKHKYSRNDTKADAPDSSNNHANGLRNDSYHIPLAEFKMGDANNPDLLDNNDTLSGQHKPPVTWADNVGSKVQMIDIEQFNEIMLKPFFSLQEYAKQCNAGALDEGSNLDDILKDDHINDELSSLHSEASLPDVISELLKRNIISEPFKFDSGSNANSTTVSSESTISVLALSRARQGTNKSNTFKAKDNIGETSDTMSISSNPDLENAFKKLGMGWASSTLKKTKERLALSSSSNTSSSSLSQFKIKSFNPNIPEPVTDTVSSILSLPDKQLQRNAVDVSKNAEQQTSKTNAMTVKEFLTNKLAKKITFNSKSKNETAEEYASLYETKMPEEMKHFSLIVREENRSIDTSLVSGPNRARTSTPVQLYRSMTYRSSSSSNMSNGLFSNADDLSSVKVTSNSMKHSTSDKDDLIIPNFSLRMKKGSSDCTKSD